MENFLAKVIIREYCNNDFWKERFISGLPSIFAEKVRARIKDHCNGQIPYKDLSYGDIISLINVMVLELCTNIKLKTQLKKERGISNSELDNFCQDFGFSNTIAPSRAASKRIKEKPYTGKPRTHKKSGSYNKRIKRPRNSLKGHKDSCWTCGKMGHKASECRVKVKKKRKLIFSNSIMI